MKKLFRLTSQGVAKLQDELVKLQAERGPIAERIKSAREFGDLAENAEYSSARQEQDQNEIRLGEIEHILANVEVIKKPSGDSKVQLGNTVKLKNGGSPKVFTIVGTVEADPLNGQISDESPIGRALIGKKVGDEVEIKTPAETNVYTITDIS